MNEPIRTQRLRILAEKMIDRRQGCDAYDVVKAADEIDQLRAEIARLKLEVNYWLRPGKTSSKGEEGSHRTA